MIDFSNEIFNESAKLLRSKYSKIKVVGESVSSATEFPTVTIDEIDNVPVERDSAKIEKYARVRYRVQVFSNSKGKRTEARNILATLDNKLTELGFTRNSLVPQPDVYNTSVYQITATYEAVIDANGVIYKS